VSPTCTRSYGRTRRGTQRDTLEPHRPRGGADATERRPTPVLGDRAGGTARPGARPAELHASTSGAGATFSDHQCSGGALSVCSGGCTGIEDLGGTVRAAPHVRPAGQARRELTSRRESLTWLWRALRSARGADMEDTPAAGEPAVTDMPTAPAAPPGSRGCWCCCSRWPARRGGHLYYASHCWTSSRGDCASARAAVAGHRHPGRLRPRIMFIVPLGDVRNRRHLVR